MGHFSLFSQVHYQGNNLEAEHIGFKLKPIGDIGTSADSLSLLTTESAQDLGFYMLQYGKGAAR